MPAVFQSEAWGLDRDPYLALNDRMFDFYSPGLSQKSCQTRGGSLGAKYSLSGIYGPCEWPTAGTPVAQSSQRTSDFRVSEFSMHSLLVHSGYTLIGLL